MQKKYLEFEKELLNKIKNGEGSIYQILILSQEYEVGTKTINKILEKQVINNRIMWTGGKFTSID
jgi:hypothetical protein